MEYYWKNSASLNLFDYLEDLFEEVMLLFVVLLKQNESIVILARELTVLVEFLLES
jgi:hypothetical protein